MAQRVAVFWDFETCPLPEQSTTGYEAVDSILGVATSYGSVTVFNLYMQTAQEPTSPSPVIQSQLERRGVLLIQCSMTESNLSTKLSADMLIFAVDTPAPATVMLMSGNPTFTYAVSLLRLRGYHVVLVIPSATPTRGGLELPASVVLDWKLDILDIKHRQARSEGTTGFNNDRDDKAGSPASRQNSLAQSSITVPKHHYSSPSRRSNPSRFEDDIITSQSQSRLGLDTDRASREHKDTDFREPRRLPPSPLADKTRHPNLPSPSIYPSPLLTRHLPPSELANSRPLKSFSQDHISADRPLDSQRTRSLRPAQVSTSILPSQSSNTRSVLTSGTSFPRNTESPEHLVANPDYFYDSSESNTPELHTVSPGSSHKLSQSISSSSAGPLRIQARADIYSAEASYRHQVARGARIFSESLPHNVKHTRLPSQDMFSPLVETLQSLESAGNSQPLRSLVGARLPKAVYGHASAADFGQYVALAERAGIIQLGGSMGKSWITLRPAQEQNP
ncbi:hypothetical protein FPV67DRAFT_1509212 [Lyophyllum atratum]|nr:hypothetical protein FPV67DRAFT_1509212 [Lyophyllum atratum]